MTSLVAEYITPEELLAMDDAIAYELVAGKLVERNVSTDSSKTALRMAMRLSAFVDRADSGDLFDSEVGIRIFPNPKTVRRADISYVRADRSPVDDSGFLEVAPDLVVEVVSPGDSAK